MTQALIKPVDYSPIVINQVSTIKGNLDEISQAQISKNTARVYRQQFYGGTQQSRRTHVNPALSFVNWCVTNQVDSLPASEDSVRLYLEYLFRLRKSPAALGLARAAIKFYHERSGHDDPTAGVKVRNQLSGMNRLIAEQISDGDRAEITPGVIFTVDDWVKLIRVIDTSTLIGKRDLALLLVGYCGGRRRDEMIHLKAEGVRFKKGSAVLRLGKSKTDQTDSKRAVMTVINLGPLPCLDALKDWMDSSGVRDGYLFRKFSGKGTLLPDGIENALWINTILQTYARAAGFDERVTWHKACRAGLINELARLHQPVGMISMITGQTAATIHEHYMGHVEDNQLATLNAFNARPGDSSQS